MKMSRVIEEIVLPVCISVLLLCASGIFVVISWRLIVAPIR